jgi:hypothetical protein
MKLRGRGDDSDMILATDSPERCCPRCCSLEEVSGLWGESLCNKAKLFKQAVATRDNKQTPRSPRPSYLRNAKQVTNSMFAMHVLQIVLGNLRELTLLAAGEPPESVERPAVAAC